MASPGRGTDRRRQRRRRGTGRPSCSTTDPALAPSRDRDGVSAIMLSRYRFDRATTDALLAADPDLDVFEATALGYIDRLRERLMEDPGRATAYLAGRLHRPPFRGLLRQGRGGPRR